MLALNKKANVYAVEPDELSEIWAIVLPFIDRPLLHDPLNMSSDEVYHLITTGKYILLVVEHDGVLIAAQTLELIVAKQGLICNLVTTGGGSIELWQDEMIAMVESIARSQGCYSVTTRGRMGWLKKLKRNGFEPRVFIAEKVLL